MSDLFVPITKDTISIWTMPPGPVHGFFTLPTKEEAFESAQVSADVDQQTKVVTLGSRHDANFCVLAVYWGGEDREIHKPEPFPTLTSDSPEVTSMSRRIRSWLGKPPPGWTLPKDDPDPMKVLLMVSAFGSMPFMEGGEAHLTVSQLKALGLHEDAKQIEEREIARAAVGHYEAPGVLRWKRRPEDYFIPPPLL